MSARCVASGGSWHVPGTNKPSLVFGAALRNRVPAERKVAFRPGWALYTHQGPLGFRQELSKLGQQVLLAPKEVGYLGKHFLFGHASERPPLRAQLLLLPIRERENE